MDDETDEEYHAVNRYPARRDTKRSAHREHQERFDSFFAHVCVFAFWQRCQPYGYPAGEVVSTPCFFGGFFAQPRTGVPADGVSSGLHAFRGKEVVHAVVDRSTAGT